LRAQRSHCADMAAVPVQERAMSGAKNERPVRGDNRTGQAIRALGVDGRSRLI
jgi:hypothetical protein